MGLWQRLKIKRRAMSLMLRCCVVCREGAIGVASRGHRRWCSEGAVDVVGLRGNKVGLDGKIISLL